MSLCKNKFLINNVGLFVKEILRYRCSLGIIRVFPINFLVGLVGEGKFLATF